MHETAATSRRQEKEEQMDKRRFSLVGFTVAIVVLAMANTAFACVTFIGKVTVDGNDGDTVAVGHGSLHDYCSNGRPTTAAAGHVGDPLSLQVQAAPQCSDPGAPATNKMPKGTYEVLYNDSSSYIYNGTSWNQRSGSGCWVAGNEGNVAVLGTFNVDNHGAGSWSGTIDAADLGTPPSYATPVTASNLCIGEQTPAPGTRFGMLLPYQLLII